MVVPMAEAKFDNSYQNWRARLSANLPKRPQECFKPRIKGTVFDRVAQKFAASDADRHKRSILGTVRDTIEFIFNNIRRRRRKKRTSSITKKNKNVRFKDLGPVDSRTSRRTLHHKKSYSRIHHLHRHHKLHANYSNPFEKSHFEKIDTNALCEKCFDHQKRACNLREVQEAVYKSNICSAKCRPAKTFLQLREGTKRPFPKATYKHTIRLDDETLAGRAFPMKIRLRRDKRNCVDCGRDLLLSEPVTVNTSVVVISNCCDITVYDKKYLENWHRVPIISVTGKGILKKKTLNDVSQREPKPKPPPPPVVQKPPGKEPRVENSCQKWRAIASANLPKPCPPDCFKPLLDQTCLEPITSIDDLEQEIINGIQPNEEVVQKIEEIVEEEPLDKSYFDKIDTKALCAKCFDHTTRTCDLSDAQQAIFKNNFCSTKCRPLKTFMHLLECSKRPYPKANYKHAVRLDDETFVGRTFPMKIRLRRIKRKCMDCDRDLFFREPVTVNTSVVVISNCCDITVYDKKYLENWDRVPIVSVIGYDTLKKKTLNEVCKLEPKPEPPPPPPEVVEEPPRARFHKGKGKKKK